MCCEVLDCTPEIDVLLRSGSDGLTSRCSVLLPSSFGPIAPPPPLRTRLHAKSRHRHELVDIGTIGNLDSEASLMDTGYNIYILSREAKQDFIYTYNGIYIIVSFISYFFPMFPLADIILV